MKDKKDIAVDDYVWIPRSGGGTTLAKVVSLLPACHDIGEPEDKVKVVWDEMRPRSIHGIYPDPKPGDDISTYTECRMQKYVPVSQVVKKVTSPARLDPEGTATGKTQIMAHIPADGKCRHLGGLDADSYTVREKE